ncbi:MAG: aerotolerance regulator BatC, partial [Paludibacteraceae bacterium]|nr:aerotolerance regulator BatC [Paludibacteraceae bacterium]
MKKIVYILLLACLTSVNGFAQKTITDYFNAGIEKYRAGSYKEAIVNFNKVLELNPKFIEAYG